MASTTISHLFDTYEQAARAVADLEAAGIPHSEISLVANNADERHTVAGTPAVSDSADAAGTGAGTGASLGTVLGGGAGLLAGLGSLAIPGVGPIVAAGWLVAALTGAGVGAAAGGLIGSLTGAGVHEEDAHVYAEGVRRGGTLVTVRADEMQAARVNEIMGQTGAVDIQARGKDYRASGWSKFDPAAPAYSTTDAEAERQRMRAGV